MAKKRLAIRAAADRLGVSPDSLRNWDRRGLLPEGSVLHSLGGHRRFDIGLIEEWLRKRERSNEARRGKESNAEA